MARIALLSDIHFGKLSRSGEFSVPGSIIDDETIGGMPFSEGLIERLKEHRVEYIFIAGDLTSIASPQEFVYCEEKILEIAYELGISEKKVICCLGNHDVDWKIAELGTSVKEGDMEEAARKRGAEKYQIVASATALYCIDEISYTSEIKNIPFVKVHEENDFVVFILNSGWQCSAGQEIPHGKISEMQLRWLEEKCKEFEEEPRKKIILMHHHPVQYPYPTIGHDVSMVEESSQILEIAGKYGIDIILHGHRHHPRAKTIMQDGWKHPIVFICAGSLAVNAKHRGDGAIPNTFHVIDIEKDKEQVELFNYQYTNASGWTPFEKWRPETPLDKYMLLGKIFEESAIEDAIKKYRGYSGLIKWDDLDECLKHQGYKTLNEKMRKILDPESIIGGDFPENVVIIPKEGV